MDDSVGLIDTPRKKSLQSQAESLRVTLKEYERTYAAEHNGHKPSRNEIKANKVVAGQYQCYQTIRDMLAGKRGLEGLETANRRKTRKGHERTDSSISLTPHRTQKTFSASKSRSHPNDIDPYDAPPSISPKVFPNAIGPTPRRDGTMLGIFDMLSNSGSRDSSQATPSNRKRKADVLYADESQATVTQSPSQKGRQSTANDTQAFPVATPRSSLATDRRNHSKTPVSDSKKFMLNHFFATPSAVRFAGVMDTPARTKTPLRDLVLGISPAKELELGVQILTQVDATPPYLKRSFCFKDRLLSAFEEPNPTSTSTRRAFSGGLRHARFAPKPLSQIISDRKQTEEQERQRQQPRDEDDNEDEDEDGLDALREMETNEVSVLVEDSQIVEDPTSAPEKAEAGQEQPARMWKKKGQKRTTRRVIMRPVKVQPVAARKPKVVEAEQDMDVDEDVDEDDNNVSRVDETQLIDTPTAGNTEPDDADMDFLDDVQNDSFDPDEDDEHSEQTPFKKPAPKQKSKSTSSSKSSPTKSKTDSKPLGKPPKTQKDSGAREADEEAGRKINPNAHSHMNFRSLKIKNKNSKAKGRGRFGRGRR